MKIILYHPIWFTLDHLNWNLNNLNRNFNLIILTIFALNINSILFSLVKNILHYANMQISTILHSNI